MVKEVINQPHSRATGLCRELVERPQVARQSPGGDTHKTPLGGVVCLLRIVKTGGNSMKLLHVYTDGQPGDTCAKKGGQSLRLGDGQCAGAKRCRYYQGMGPFVTIKCTHPEAHCLHVQQPAQDLPKPDQAADIGGEPVYQTYRALKKRYPDTILLLRLGDFYEAFNEDARVVAEVCDLVLTSRLLRGKDQTRVAMAGVPHFAVENYVARLIEASHKVGLCERVGEPVTVTSPAPVQEAATPSSEPASPAQLSLF